MSPLEIVDARLVVYRKIQERRDPLEEYDRNGWDCTGDIIMALEIVRDEIEHLK